jgi:PadR family transcriptional regulator PadR
MVGKAVYPDGTEGRPRNWLVLVMLLSLWRGNSYGYELIEWAAAFGLETINPGSVYRTLRQMENEGLCNSEWETTSKGGPLRRMYSVTDAGEAYLDLLAKGLKQYQQTIDYFLRQYSSRRQLRKAEDGEG